MDYQTEEKSWEEILPILKPGTIYCYTPKYKQWLESKNVDFEKRGFQKLHTGFFRIRDLDINEKYVSFEKLTGEEIYISQGYISPMTEAEGYDKEDLDLILDLSDIGL